MKPKKGPIVSDSGWWVTGPFTQIVAVNGAYGGQLYALDRDGQVWSYQHNRWSMVSHVRADSPLPPLPSLPPLPTPDRDGSTWWTDCLQDPRFTMHDIPSREDVTKVIRAKQKELGLSNEYVTSLTIKIMSKP